jgi:hypothetical protein
VASGLTATDGEGRFLLQARYRGPVPTVTLPTWPKDFGEPAIGVDERLAVELVTHRTPKSDHGIEISGDPAELLAASDGFEKQAAILLTAAMEEDQAAVLLAGTMTNPESLGLRAKARWYQRAAQRIRRRLR